MQRDSPTVGKGMIKIFLSITASMNWIVKTTDIKSAFLQGKILDRDVFLKPPPESNLRKEKIWRLKHCLYGLKDGARQFLFNTPLGNISNGTGSTESHVIWIVDNESNSCPIKFASKQNQTCSKITIAAVLSLQDGLESSFYHRRIIEDILGLKHQTIPIEAYIDNKSVVEAVYSTKLVDDKRLRIDIAAIAESLASKEVNNIKWCPGDKQLANCMTKFELHLMNFCKLFKQENVEGLCLNSEIIHNIFYHFMFVTWGKIIPRSEGSLNPMTIL
ncbi:unnamed protein product [Mytilus coruscus]|uniref:Reverse transcriptase Ty1/copia-type domain-containing protein n=1 Tax=Mytilus coruscus TaxID=42192 RepID=A0A6J8BDI8_MYTCO|nr:unnamed protein product [Mytilus coruscus]